MQHAHTCVHEWGCQGVSCVAACLGVRSVHEALRSSTSVGSWHASYPHYAQALLGQDVHEIVPQAGVAPPVHVDILTNNHEKLDIFCDQPPNAWYPKQAASRKKVVGRVCISKACCTCSTPVVGLYGLMVFILRCLRHFLPTSSVSECKSSRE